MRAVLAVIWIAGCAAPGGPLDEARPLAELSFDADGRTAPLELPSEEVALWTVADAGTCFALEGALPARGAALDVLGAAGPVRFQRVRCETGTPLREPLERALDVSWIPVTSAPSGRIALRFVITERSVLRGDADAQRALLAALDAELARAGLAPELRAVVEVDGAPVESRFWDLAPDALDALRALASPAPEATIDVVFAGCLRRVDPTGLPAAVEGFTGRVGGGGGGAADAIFLPGLRCDAFDDTPAPLDVDGTAHVLAHELGHFLGLPHVDDETNVMHPNPRLASARVFTDAQTRRMRRHPFVRPD